MEVVPRTTAIFNETLSMVATMMSLIAVLKLSTRLDRASTASPDPAAR
jgi:hypothetical protein